MIARPCCSSPRHDRRPRSTKSTSSPARIRWAPSVPPMAPAPQIRIGRAHAQPAFDELPRFGDGDLPDAPSCPRPGARSSRRNCRRRVGAHRLGSSVRMRSSRSSASAGSGWTTPCEARPGEILHPGGMRGDGSISFTLRSLGRAPPVVEPHRTRVVGHPFDRQRLGRLVAAMAVDDEDPPEAGG